MWPGRIAEVGTGRRVLKHNLAPLRGVWRASIASVFQKFQLKFKDIQQVTLVFSPYATSRSQELGSQKGLWDAVAVITSLCDQDQRTCFGCKVSHARLPFLLAHAKSAELDLRAPQE
jgi:hypothetical protein